MFKKLFMALFLVGVLTSLTACVTKEDGEKIRVAIYDTAIMDIIDAAGYENFNIQALGTPHTLLKEHLEVYASEGKSIDLGIHTAVNYENLVLLDPEVVILSSRFEQWREQISSAVPNAKIYTGKYEYTEFYKGVLDNIEMLKEVFPEASKSIDKVFEPVNQEIISLRNDVMTYNKSVLVLLANNNNIATHGMGGRFDMIFSTFGFRDALVGVNDPSLSNCDTLAHGCNIGYEFFGKFNPDVVLIIDRANSVEGAVSAGVTNLKNSQFFQDTNASKNNEVYDLSSNAFYVNPGGISSTRTMIANLRQLLA